jgi:hypothetical protein
MERCNTHPYWENRPLRLSEEEKKNLYGVLEDFFSNFHLKDVREMLWDWLVAALSSENGAYESGHSRSNLIFVYEKLELLIEAAHGLHWKRKLRKAKRERRKRRLLNRERFKNFY